MKKQTIEKVFKRYTGILDTILEANNENNKAELTSSIEHVKTYVNTEVDNLFKEYEYIEDASAFINFSEKIGNILKDVQTKVSLINEDISLKNEICLGDKEPLEYIENIIAEINKDLYFDTHSNRWVLPATPDLDKFITLYGYKFYIKRVKALPAQQENGGVKPLLLDSSLLIGRPDFNYSKDVQLKDYEIDDVLSELAENVSSKEIDEDTKEIIAIPDADAYNNGNEENKEPQDEPLNESCNNLEVDFDDKFFEETTTSDGYHWDYYGLSWALEDNIVFESVVKRINDFPLQYTRETVEKYFYGKLYNIFLVIQNSDKNKVIEQVKLSHLKPHTKEYDIYVKNILKYKILANDLYEPRAYAKQSKLTSFLSDLLVSRIAIFNEYKTSWEMCFNMFKSLNLDKKKKEIIDDLYSKYICIMTNKDNILDVSIIRFNNFMNIIGKTSKDMDMNIVYDIDKVLTLLNIEINTLFNELVTVYVNENNIDSKSNFDIVEDTYNIINSHLNFLGKESETNAKILNERFNFDNSNIILKIISSIIEEANTKNMAEYKNYLGLYHKKTASSIWNKIKKIFTKN